MREVRKLTQHELRIIWNQFIGSLPEGGREISGIRPVILESWRRCVQRNVNPFQKAAPLILQGLELTAYKRNFRELLEIAVPVMDNLYRFVAGGGFIVILAASDGLLLEVIGDQEIKHFVEKGHFMAGARWSEEAAGTNAVGTSLKLAQPLQVAGYEHFCVSSHRWTCSSAVIHGPDGEVAGAIDITGPDEKVHSHTLGMVVIAASAIEAQLKLKRTMRSLELSNAYKNTIIESISEGLLAIDEAGFITQINKVAADIFGLNVEAVLNRKVTDVIGSNAGAISNLLGESMYITDQEIGVETRSGKQYFLVTSRPIGGPEKWEGTVLLFSEIARARKLVQRMSGIEAKFTFDDLIGKSKNFLETVHIARSVGDSTSNILLLGESGTGKDIFAQAIHNASNRRKGPFIAINCGAMPRELIASELFGYAEGAFTGAKRGGKPGKFELASGGTIFLDEIGEMPLDLQVMLLRVIEHKTVRRLAGDDSIPVDVRIIAATNKDIEEEVIRGSFRLDLFYRLNVVTIRMVPLRERKEDIPLLAEHFLKQFSLKLRRHEVIHANFGSMELLKHYDWPGNVRELQNLLERAMNIGNDLNLSIKTFLAGVAGLGPRGHFSATTPITKYERELMTDLLQRYNRNITRVAAELGVARSTVYRKLAKYELWP